MKHLNNNEKTFEIGANNMRVTRLLQTLTYAANDECPKMLLNAA